MDAEKIVRPSWIREGLDYLWSAASNMSNIIFALLPQVLIPQAVGREPGGGWAHCEVSYSTGAWA